MYEQSGTCACCKAKCETTQKEQRHLLHAKNCGIGLAGRPARLGRTAITVHHTAAASQGAAAVQQCIASTCSWWHPERRDICRDWCASIDANIAIAW